MWLLIKWLLWPLFVLIHRWYCQLVLSRRNVKYDCKISWRSAFKFSLSHLPLLLTINFLDDGLKWIIRKLPHSAIVILEGLFEVTTYTIQLDISAKTQIIKSVFSLFPDNTVFVYQSKNDDKQLSFCFWILRVLVKINVMTYDYLMTNDITFILTSLSPKAKYDNWQW